MSPKNNTKVLIGGTVYTLSGEESEEYIQRVALYINNKLDNLKSSSNGQMMNSRLIHILLAINIADDLFKEKEHGEKFNKRLSDQDQKIKELETVIDKKETHCTTLEKEIEELENKLQSYKKELDEYIEIFEEAT